MTPHNATSQAAITPQSALEALLEGNRRFAAGRSTRIDVKQQINATSDGQWPLAAVLSCIDSRVPPRIVFDQGLGDLFCANVAGNIVNPDILGSLEFACKLAGAKLIMVLGHSRCGAVMGACDGVQLGNLTGLLAKLAPAVEAAEASVEPDQRNSKNAALVQAAAEHNVRLSMQGLREGSETLTELIDTGQIAVVGAMYDVTTGEVRLLGS